MLKPKSDTLGQVKDQLKLAELTANIDALTGGQFSASLARSGGAVIPSATPSRGGGGDGSIDL